MSNHTRKVRTSFQNLPYWLVKYAYIPFGSKRGVEVIEERIVQERNEDKAYELMCDILGREPIGDGMRRIEVSPIAC